MARTRTRALVTALVGVMVAFGVQVVAATPAAAIFGLTNITTVSANNSNVYKYAVADCPAGTRVIGGGARLTAANSQVSVTHMSPTEAETGYEARAYEDKDGFLGAWQLRVTAVCAPMPAGYEVRTATSPNGSPATASIPATCSAGRQVLGTGGAVAPGRGGVVLTGIVPSPAVGPTTVTARAAETQGGFGSGWTVQAWAICAFPVAGHTIVSPTSASNSLSPKTHQADCPTGRGVHGVGFEHIGAGVGEVFLNAAYPTPDVGVGTGVPVTASEDQDGVGGSWSIRTYAICAT